MHINLESTEKHGIQAYTDREIKVDSINYQKNLIVTSQEIIAEWPIKSIQSLNEELLAPLLRFQPEIILIGHRQLEQFPPAAIREILGKQRIGFECMSISAACRTFNILLSELRRVTLGLILE